MRFFTLAPFAFVAAALVQAQTVPIGARINIQDYKGNVFDMSGSGAGQNTPVQTLNHKPGEIAQGWVIEPSSVGQFFTIRNVASGTFLSYSAVNSTGVDPLNTQAVGNLNQFPWTITGTGVGFLILGPSGINGQTALTSWPTLNASNGNILPLQTSPLTLQTRDSTGNAAVQTFTFPP
ncbi:hypothetical protein GGX14DRAFT_454149, partial [Mycena pura]